VAILPTDLDRCGTVLRPRRFVRTSDGASRAGPQKPIRFARQIPYVLGCLGQAAPTGGKSRQPIGSGLVRALANVAKIIAAHGRAAVIGGIAVSPRGSGWIIAQAVVPGIHEVSSLARLAITYAGSAAIMFGGVIAWFFGVDL
jgi:hypothetical protein